MSENKEETTPKRKKKKGGGKFFLVMTLLICCLGALFLKAAFFFALIGLLPTLVFYVSDMSKGRELYRTVMAANFAGLLPYGASLVTAPNHGIDEYERLGDMQAWLVIYSAVGAGWVLVWVCPYIAEFIADVKNSARISRLEYLQKQLQDEWGPEIHRH